MVIHNSADLLVNIFLVKKRREMLFQIFEKLENITDSNLLYKNFTNFLLLYILTPIGTKNLIFNHFKKIKSFEW